MLTPETSSEQVPWVGWRRLQIATFCVLMMALLVAIQYRSGAFTADVAADNDEPAHAVTCLMVRDYIVQDFPHNPVTYARTYYAHYSKVGIGHWPPLFYCCEALWMLLFGRTRVALLLFVALNGALLLGSIFAEVRRRTSIAAALLSVAMLMMCSAFYPVLLGVRSDLLLALLIFWATVHGGEWMHSHSQKSRHRFCAFAALALLVHGRAAVLLFLPFLLLFAFPPRTPWKWVVAGLVLLLALQLPHVFSVSNPFRLRTAAFDAWMYLLGTERLATWPAILLALAGSPLVFKNGPTRPFWAAVASLAAAGFIFYVLVPVYWDGRYLLPTVTAVAVLAGGGVQVLLDALAKHGSPQRRWLIAAVTVAAVVVIGRAAYFSPAKPDLGYRKMMANCLLCGHSVGLVAGDATQEGDLIAEAALSDPTLSRTMLRASKVLAKSTWSGYDYRTLYSSPAQVLDYLDRAKVSIIVIHNASTRDDVSELRSALALSGPNWVSDDRTYAAQKVTVFRRPTQPGAAAH